MHHHNPRLLAIALLVLSGLFGFLLAAVSVAGVALTPRIALAALGVAAVLFASMLLVRSRLRTARWDAGHRLR
jgi:hypothetical protein